MAVSDFENAFEGERVFLVGNGPSLEDTPLELLTDEWTFAMNGIHHIYPETKWRPSFYMFIKNDFKKVTKEEVIRSVETGAECFIGDEYRDALPHRENVHFLPVKKLKSEDMLERDDTFHRWSLVDAQTATVDQISPYWSTDPVDGVYRYHAMYAAYQLVSYMGFDRIYLVGCDLGFEDHAPHMIFEHGLDPRGYTSHRNFARDAFANETFLGSLVNGLAFTVTRRLLASSLAPLLAKHPRFSDPNHFEGSYIPLNQDKSYVDAEITKSHILAKKMLAREGIKTYNATVGGELEVHERIDLIDLLGESDFE